MPLFNDGVMQYLSAGLDAASLRQETIANNLANLNTPNFNRSTVSFEEQLQKAREAEEGRGSLERTHPDHLPQSPATLEPTVQEEASTRRIDGNNVDLEREMLSMVNNQVRYNAMAQRTSDRFDNWQYVINEGW